MASTLHDILTKIIKTGSLTVRGPEGERHYGDGGGRRVALRFTDADAEKAVAWDPQLQLGQTYMDGRLTVEEGDIYELLALIKDNSLSQGLSFGMIWNGLRRILAGQLQNLLPINRNRRNVAHHYDLDGRLFSLFLDTDWQYSCALFDPPEASLDEAQLLKKRHIAAKLLAEPGHKALEIGSGWGGLAIYLAETAGLDVTGITLSEEQWKVSRERAGVRGLDGQVRFELADYRNLDATRRFDRIVSVGMFEHVGRHNHPGFFRKAAQLLEDDGVMLLHSIGQSKPGLVNNPWLEKYIFPGGYIPSLAEVLPAVEKAGLLVTDIEILPMHYAWTLEHWRRRFLARRAEAAALYDERFVRMWDFYLAGSQMAFTHEGFFVFQMQLVKKYAAVPSRRSYIPGREAALRQAEEKRPPLAPVTLDPVPAPALQTAS